MSSHRSLSPAAPVFVFIAMFLAGCGSGSQAAVDACSAACDTQKEACPSFDQGGCQTICEAYGVTADSDACVDAIIAWQDCLAAQTYTCFDELAVPDDIEACDAAFDAYLSDC